MLKKRYRFFIFSFFLFSPFGLLNLFSQEVPSLRIRQNNFSIDGIQKITFERQNIHLLLKNNSNLRVFLEQPCYFIHPTVSALNPEIETFSYYPNPVIDMLHLSDNNNWGKIYIYDIQGKLLKRHQTEDTTVSLDLSDLRAGMYLIKTSAHFFRIIKK